MIQVSPQRERIRLMFQKTHTNLNISAKAGTGKTTTLVDLLSLVPRGKSALLVAFNNSIVDELKNRVKDRIDRTDISTLHSYGWGSIRMRYGFKVKLNKNKVVDYVAKILNKEGDTKKIKKKGYYFYIITKLVDLMRLQLIEPTEDAVNELLEYHGIIAEDYDIKLAIMVFKKVVNDKRQFDFTDMIYQPVADKSIKCRKYDYVFCDESQDFSLCQHELVRLSLNRNGRLITVGDERQAIYGFAGADNNSYEKLATLNGNSIKLPLSICYRCSKAVIREAQQIVPQISFHPDSPEGLVTWGSLTEIERGDWVLCRNLKPLVQVYLWLMKNKIKSKIKGKDIGEGILNLINKIGAKTISRLTDGLSEQREKLIQKLTDKGWSSPQNSPKVQLFDQRAEVICCLINEVSTVKELKDLINDIFSDEIKGIMLSTIHKSKGLENDRVFFLLPGLIPSQYAEQPWQVEQEMNLKYVCITRAKKELVYVCEEDFKNDLINKIKL